MEDHILDAVEADPKINISQVSTQLGVSQTNVDREVIIYTIY